MKATISDLRYRTKDVLKAVERGETVTVLCRGKEKARIVPLPSKKRRNDLRTDQAFGLWKDRKDMRNVATFVRNMRKGRFFDL
jgi:prevent-host-death family protein